MYIERNLASFSKGPSLIRKSLQKIGGVVAPTVLILLCHPVHTKQTNVCSTGVLLASYYMYVPYV